MLKSYTSPSQLPRIIYDYHKINNKHVKIKLNRLFVHILRNYLTKNSTKKKIMLSNKLLHIFVGNIKKFDVKLFLHDLKLALIQCDITSNPIVLRTIKTFNKDKSIKINMLLKKFYSIKILAKEPMTLKEKIVANAYIEDALFFTLLPDRLFLEIMSKVGITSSNHKRSLINFIHRQTRYINHQLNQSECAENYILEKSKNIRALYEKRINTFMLHHPEYIKLDLLTNIFKLYQITLQDIKQARCKTVRFFDYKPSSDLVILENTKTELVLK